MPTISKAATVAQSSEWRAERQTRLYHLCIDILVQQINELTPVQCAAVVDPSNEIAEVLVEALKWNMMSREWNVTVSDLQELHRKSVPLLELLKIHLPDRIGGAEG